MRKSLIIALAAACLVTSGPALARKAGGGQQETLSYSPAYDAIANILSYFGIRL
jgi:hypothetical protein